MKTTRVDRLYRALDGADRYRAFVAAAVAGDVRETERILASCPRVPVLMPEPTFDRLNQAGLGLHSALGLWAGYWIGWLDAIELFRERLGESENAEPGAMICLLEDVEAQVATGLVSLLAALAEATGPVPGLDSDQVLAAMPSPVSDGLERHRQTLDATEPVEELTAAARAFFAEVLDAAGIPEADER